jgi:hypothetical protein
MEGTEGAYCTPIFSPDGQWIAFFDTGRGELKKMAIQGGPPVTLVRAGGMRGATWGGDDSIIYADQAAPGLKKISSAGGAPVSLTQVDASKGQTAHRWPTFLPGGKAFLFAIEKGKSPDDAQIVVQRLDTGQRKLIVQAGTFPQYVSAGYLVYVQRRRLMALPFDVGRCKSRVRRLPFLKMSRNPALGRHNSASPPKGRWSMFHPLQFREHSGGWCGSAATAPNSR